jgi:ubiquinone/menaquinone biosynthesis C-methylase UbiE
MGTKSIPFGNKFQSKGFHSEDIKYMQELIPSGSSILEIGCGNGHLIGSLKPISGVGIDISSGMIIEAKKKYENLKFIVADIEDTNCIKNLDQTFDFIIISDTVGYLNDIENTFERLHKVLVKPWATRRSSIQSRRIL